MKRSALRSYLKQVNAAGAQKMRASLDFNAVSVRAARSPRSRCLTPSQPQQDEDADEPSVAAAEGQDNVEMKAGGAHCRPHSH